MSGYDGPGDGWHEVGSDATAERLLVLHEAGKPTRVWAEDEPVPPLPTEPYTVIRAQIKDLNEGHLFLFDGDWWASLTFGIGESFSGTSLYRRITGFEVLAQPITALVRQDEEAIQIERARERDQVRHDTAEAVIAAIRANRRASQTWSTAIGMTAQEFGIVS